MANTEKDVKHEQKTSKSSENELNNEEGGDASTESKKKTISRSFPKLKAANKDIVFTKKKKSIIPNDRTMANKHKKYSSKLSKHKEKHSKKEDSKKKDVSNDNKDDSEEFSKEVFAQRSIKGSSHDIKPEKIRNKESNNQQSLKKRKSSDLQEQPALKYKKVTYLSVIEGKKFYSIFLL